MKTLSPKNLFNYKRLDLIVKYLYAKEILEENKNDYSSEVYKDLYIRHIILRNMGIEPKRHYEKQNKFNIGDFCFNFRTLLESMQKRGFDTNNPIRISKDYYIENGAHRIAISQLLGLEIPYLAESTVKNLWNFDWFDKNGFTTEDKQRILKCFVDINIENCTIFVVWNPLFKYLENLKAIFNKYFDIVGDIELDFEDNHIAFTNVLLEIYEPNIRDNENAEETILAKSKLLQANYLNFKVFVLTNQEKNKNVDINILSKQCKEFIRETFNHILPKECYCTVHFSEGIEETKYLSNILLSPNNIKHLKMRLSYKYNREFVNRVRNMKNLITNLKIDSVDDICAIGSAVMITLGIQENSDVDFITLEKYRNRLGWDSIHLNDDYDIGVSERVAKRPKKINDDILINNSDYHFYFKGQKFINLEILKDRKRFSKRTKDINHLRQIELHEKLIGNINQRKLLMERIDAEKNRRQEKKKKKAINIEKKDKYKKIVRHILSIIRTYI